MEQELKNRESSRDNEEIQKDLNNANLDSPIKPKLLNGKFDPIQTKQFCKKFLIIYSNPSCQKDSSIFSDTNHLQFSNKT
jgi:hypothetical protein